MRQSAPIPPHSLSLFYRRLFAALCLPATLGLSAAPAWANDKTVDSAVLHWSPEFVRERGRAGWWSRPGR